jgi:acetyl-CoA carboxylase biotin carboxyl carrier protein
MDLKEIQNLIKFVSNSELQKLLEMDDVKITIRTTLENTTPEV